MSDDSLEQPSPLRIVPSCATGDTAMSDEKPSWEWRQEVEVLEKERQRLVEANEYWHRRVEQMKLQFEAVKAERDDWAGRHSNEWKRVEDLKQQLVEVRTELASYAWTVSPAMVQAKIDQLNQQLAEMTQEWITMLTQTSLDLRTVPLPDGVEQAKVRINLWIKKLKEQP